MLFKLNPEIDWSNRLYEHISKNVTTKNNEYESTMISMGIPYVKQALREWVVYLC